MADASIEEIVPEQEQGKQTDTSHKHEYETIEEAKAMFSLVKDRILHVNQWHDLTGKGTASFQVIGENGEKLDREARVGDRIKINIPGPGSKSGHGFDWVKVEKIEDKSDPDSAEEAFVMRVRPTDNPDRSSAEVAHFFQNSATSSFAVQRINKEVITSVHGRNEIPNKEGAGWLDKLRNFLIGLFAGAGLSLPQWKSLVVALQKKA